MKGHIYIDGQIGTSYKEDGSVDVKGVELVDVISQVRNNDGCELIECHISSPGGSVEVGRLIADYIGSLPNVHTIAEVQCASIATEIHLAVPLERRSITTGTDYTIHQPMFSISRGVSLNTDELALMSTEIGKTQTEMVSVYSKATGMDKKALESLMKQETALTPEQCKEFGFVSQIITTPMRAVALLTPTKKDDMSKLTEEIKALRMQVASIVAGQTVAPAKKGKSISLKVEKIALDLTTMEGVDVIVTDPDGDPNIDLPIIGDLITLADGSAVEDGTYQFPQGQMVVVGGVITDVLAPLEEEVDVEALKSEMEALKKENEDAKTALAELTKDVTAMAKLTSTYKPKAQQTAFKKKDEVPSEKDAYNAIKEARKAKRTTK
jgi:ATP-dependent protease ClpP protease subunit